MYVDSNPQEGKMNMLPLGFNLSNDFKHQVGIWNATQRALSNYTNQHGNRIELVLLELGLIEDGLGKF